MDIYLDDKTSLVLLRTAAVDKDLVLTPADTQAPKALTNKPIRLNRLGIPELLGYLSVPQKNSLGIVVPNAQARVRAKGVACTVCSNLRGSTPFLTLGSVNGTRRNPIVPGDATVYVQSPANVVLGMARRLRRMEIERKINHRQSVLMLVKLCLELCGTYVHDPFDPHNGSVTFGTEPMLSQAQLMEFLQEEGVEQGLSLTREAASLAYDLSGSPQESFMGPALFFNSRLGGLHLCDFEANKALDLSPSQLESIGNRTITPDFQLVGYNAVVEYLGAIHEAGDNPRIDHKRSLDYQTLGKREFAFWYEDVKTQASFMESAARIVAMIGQYEGPSIRKRFARLKNDPDFIGRQKELFAVFRPWLRDKTVTSSA